MKFYTIREMREILGVSAQTLRNWDRSGKLKPHHTSPNGYRYYSDDSLKQLLNQPINKVGKVVGYCRVSSAKQQDDLARQVECMRMYLLAQGKPFEIISDIGSGINYKRKGFLQIIEGMATRDISKVVVLYKDRLMRFGYEIIEHLADLYDCELEVVDTSDKPEEQELVEDLVQIITVFSCKLHGKRAGKAKKIIAELTGDD